MAKTLHEAGLVSKKANKCLKLLGKLSALIDDARAVEDDHQASLAISALYDKAMKKLYAMLDPVAESGDLGWLCEAFEAASRLPSVRMRDILCEAIDSCIGFDDPAETPEHAMYYGFACLTLLPATNPLPSFDNLDPVAFFLARNLMIPQTKIHVFPTPVGAESIADDLMGVIGKFPWVRAPQVSSVNNANAPLETRVVVFWVRISAESERQRLRIEDQIVLSQGLAARKGPIDHDPIVVEMSQGDNTQPPALFAPLCLGMPLSILCGTAFATLEGDISGEVNTLVDAGIPAENIVAELRLFARPVQHKHTRCLIELRDFVTGEIYAMVPGPEYAQAPYFSGAFERVCKRLGLASCDYRTTLSAAHD